jgi:hypothetical protein
VGAAAYLVPGGDPAAFIDACEAAISVENQA